MIAQRCCSLYVGRHCAFHFRYPGGRPRPPVLLCVFLYAPWSMLMYAPDRTTLLSYLSSLRTSRMPVSET